MNVSAWPSATLILCLASVSAHAQQTESAKATTPAPAAAPAPAAPTDLTATGDAAKSADAVKSNDAAKPGDAPKPGDPAVKAGDESAPKPPADAASIKVERTASGAKLFRITEGLVVEGQMQKPAAFYVLRRAAIHYDYSELGKSFLPKIGAAVKAPPF